MSIFFIEKNIYNNFISLFFVTLLLGCGNSSQTPRLNQINSETTASDCRKNVHSIRKNFELIDKNGSAQIKKNDLLRALTNHIPPRVRKFSDLGSFSSSREIPITIMMKLNHEKELDKLLGEIYDPRSPRYHHFLSSQEFKARFSPSHDQINQVKSFLVAQGLKSTTLSKNELLLHAVGSINQLNAAFQTEIHRYQDQGSPDGLTESSPRNLIFSPAYEFQVPKELPIQAVHGLQNVTRFHNYLTTVTSNLESAPASLTPQASGPRGGLTPLDIKKAYELPENLTGSGQTLALFELDGYQQTDIAAYSDYFGLPSVPMDTILVDGASGSPSGSGGENEVTLDIELMIAVAPHASKILVYEGPNSEQGMLDTFSQIADDNIAKQVSSSWGVTEEQTTAAMVQSENTIFKQMAAQGQSLYVAVGDSGANDNGSSLSVDDPGSQPYVVGVGGTQLATQSDGSYRSETTWNNPSGGAGGGGISTIWTQPQWQNDLATPQNLASSDMRNVPDVSLNADPRTGYSIYTHGSWTIFGGTSCAAPIWAAFNALVNQQRVADNRAPLGFPNPMIYQIGRGSRYGSDFNNVHDGSTNQYYPATIGYNDATGWGSFRGVSLLNDLSTDPSASETENSACTSEQSRS